MGDVGLKKSEWVNVDDELPEKNGQYLVKISKTPFNPCGMSIDSFSRVVNPYFSSERISREKVTHWMPLPVTESEKINKIDPRVQSIIDDAHKEAERAIKKYPQPNYVALKVAEESGEVVRDAVHCAEGRQTYDNLRTEIVQNIAMLIRLITEGDQVIGLNPLPMEDENETYQS